MPKEINEIWKIIKELAESQKKTDRTVGRVTNGWGLFVEGMVEPSVSKIFGRKGIKIEQVHPRVTSRKDGETMEIDVLLIGKDRQGTKKAIAVEAKSHLVSEDVKDFLGRLDEFRRFFETWRDMDVVGVVAAMRMHESVRKFAERNGLYVLAPSGDVMVPVNSKAFRPRIWRHTTSVEGNKQ